MTRRRAMGTLVISILGLVLPKGALAQTWTLQSPAIPTAANGVFSASACSSTSACTAVGYALNGAGATVPLIERSAGSGWVVQNAAAVAGAAGARLNAVSCPTASACTAVGESTDSSGATHAVIENWNGSGWSAVAAPVPSGATGESLAGISCPAAGQCEAVGTYTDFFGVQNALALVETAKGWALQTITNPSGVTAASLDAVSCTTVSACTAVGSLTTSSGTSSLAERWSGTKWAQQVTSDPAGAAKSVLDGVACPTATFCEAVGKAVNSTGVQVAMAQSWNGSTWTLQSANPAGVTGSELRAVACPSASNCEADGSLTDSSSHTQVLAESYTGSGWVSQSVPLGPGATTGGLHAVSCPAAGTCIAAGYQSPGGSSTTLVDGWNGSAWTVQATKNPNGATTSELHGVACPGSTGCVAVGYSFNSLGAGVTLGEIWNGTSWAIRPTPNPAGATRSTFNGVACAAATSCLGVGYSVTSTGADLNLAEAWNGTAWSLQTVPSPTGARKSLLAAVACPAAGSCMSVGDAVNASDVKVTLAEKQSGTAWSVVSTPNPAGATGSVLRGISCLTTSACTAVGSYVSSAGTQPLVEGWNGTTWSQVVAPTPAGATTSQLVSVSCVSSSACVAVGSQSGGAAGSAPLVEVWNGTAWRVVAAAMPAGAASAVFTGVACTATTTCTAVGDAVGSSGASQSLAELWNGSTWTVDTTPAPSGASAGALDGVACTAATTCTATGYARSAVSLPLAMHST